MSGAIKSVGALMPTTKSQWILIIPQDSSHPCAHG